MKNFRLSFLLLFLIPFLATRTAQSAPFNFVQDFPGLEQSFGRAMSMDGDLNGDGVPDLVIGSSEEVKFNPHINKSGQLAYDTIGKVFVYSGATGQLLYEFSGKTNDKFGVSVESGCDIDGDGYADILIGAVEGILLGSSYVRIISGRTGQDLYSVTESNSRVFGQTIACAGDVNGDGKGDFLVGAPDEFDSFVKLYSGANGASLGVFTQGDRDFGASLAGGKDFDGDGVPDFIIGDPEYKVSSADINDPLCQSILVPFDAQLGRAIVYSGKPGFSELFEIIGGVDCDTKRGDYLGREVSFAGDINGDGFQDLMVISETGESVFGNLGEGNLRILSGKDFQILNTISIDASWYYYNFKHFARLGDLDADGADDYVVSSPELILDPLFSSMALVFSGLTGGVLQVIDYPAGEFGFTVSAGRIANQAASTLLAISDPTNPPQPFVRFYNPTGSFPSPIIIPPTPVPTQTPPGGTSNGGGNNGGGNNGGGTNGHGSYSAQLHSIKNVLPGARKVISSRLRGKQKAKALKSKAAAVKELKKEINDLIESLKGGTPSNADAISLDQALLLKQLVNKASSSRTPAKSAASYWRRVTDMLKAF